MSSETYAILSHVMRVNRIIRWQIRFHETLGNTCGVPMDFCGDCEAFISGVAYRDWFSN